MIKWLLDTDTCIGIIKRQPPAAIRKLTSKSVGQVGISAITLSELEYGASRSGRPDAARAALSEFLLPLIVAPFDSRAAQAYGPVRAALEKLGQPIGPLDTLIAAHALALDTVLVSHNLREFRRIPELRVEDWLK